jgi:hypothetical protein
LDLARSMPEALARVKLFVQQAAARAGQEPSRTVVRGARFDGLQSMGTWVAVRLLAQTVPFFDARLQGFHKLGRGAAENSQRFTAVLGAARISRSVPALQGWGRMEAARALGS